MAGITGGMVLKILPLALQNGLKIPREGAFLAQGRINAPPHRQCVASIGVGIVPIIILFRRRGVNAAGGG